jgi:hypothetical protein
MRSKDKAQPGEMSVNTKYIQNKSHIPGEMSVNTKV